MKILLVKPSHQAHQVWFDTYNVCLEQSEQIVFEEKIFPNSVIDSGKILDFFNIKKVLSLYRQVCSLYIKDEPSKVILFGPELNYIWLATIIRILTNAEVWYMMHEPYVLTQKGFKVKVVQAYNILMSKLVNKIIVTSSEAKNISNKYYSSSNKFIFIPFASIAVEKKVTIAEEYLAKNTLDVNTSNIFTYFGSAVASKRPDRLNKVADLLRDCTKKFQIIRAGKDINISIEYDELVTVIDKFISEKEKVELLLKSKVIVLPYDSLSQSGIIVEALGYGKIILASDIDGFKQYDTCESVFLVDFNNTHSLKEMLFFLMNIKETDLLKYHQISKKYFIANFSRKVINEAFTQIGLI